MDLQKMLGEIENRMSEIQDEIDLKTEKMSEMESQYEYLQMESGQLQNYLDRLGLTHKQLMRLIERVEDLGTIIDCDPIEF